jgi:hypothetical protein
MKFVPLSNLTSVGAAAFLAVGTTCANEPTREPPAIVCPQESASPSTAASLRAEILKPDSGELTERIIEHISYLRDVFKTDLITADLAREARVAWFECWAATGYTLPVPAACTGPDGQLQYVWDRDEHHLELNFSPSESASFFYRNRRTGDLWMEDYTAGAVDLATIEKLKLVV